ncbi:MAG TPA: SRPBCC domain-containing protein [Anaerolineales bacterium]
MKLFVDRSIEIHASAQRVWDILTLPAQNADWASEFSGGGPALHIESDWSLGSPVLWKDRKGRVVVEGNVTDCVPHALLRHTVFDVESARPAVGPDDGITYKLTEREGTTVLWVSQGDFSTMPDGAKYRDLSEAIWDRALTRIKHRAEGRAPRA